MKVISHIIETGLPYIITLLELMGIFVVTWTALKGFWSYIQNSFMKKNIDLQTNLARGFATGLEFKMGAEILRTVLVKDLSELYILGAVILLRALLSILIHIELKKKKEDNIRD
ncbi:MAG: DUF1622 domain-containing protein [Clostridia bacterium]|nr:DUF1622 domain-containing protein [Clostridia bacterium]